MPPTETVRLEGVNTDTELEVVAEPTPEIMDLFTSLSEFDPDDPAAHREEFLDVLPLLVVDDSRSADGLSYSDREIWEQLLDTFGYDHLIKLYGQVSEPALTYIQQNPFDSVSGGSRGGRLYRR